MATQAERRKWRRSVEAALDQHEGAERYLLRQRQLRSGRGPQQYDGRGFPVPQPIPGFLERVKRLRRDD